MAFQLGQEVLKRCGESMIQQAEQEYINPSGSYLDSWVPLISAYKSGDVYRKTVRFPYKMMLLWVYGGCFTQICRSALQFVHDTNATNASLSTFNNSQLLYKTLAVGASVSRFW